MAAPAAIAPFEGFIKTDSQREACDLMRDHEITMLEGGARSGKTFIIIRQQIVRGIKYKSRHLAARPGWSRSMLKRCHIWTSASKHW